MKDHFKQSKTEPYNISPSTHRMGKNYIFAVLLSLVLHGIGLWFFLLHTISFDKKNHAEQVWLKDKINSQNTSPEEQVKTKTVVEIKLIPHSRPKKADYLAEHDQSTEKEQKRKYKNVQKSRASKAVMPDKVEPRGLKPRQAKNKFDPYGFRYDSAESFEEKEYLPLVPEGDATEINAWQWRHASYFNRIKELVRSHWNPGREIAMNDPEGSLLGNQDRMTTLSVTIDTKGGLTNVDIIKESGVRYLDSEATRAFREAAPFLFPPKELFKNKENFTFSFSFHLQLNRGLSLNFNWDNK